MWTWDPDTLEVIGFQDIKARANLMDVSPDGQYCSYYAEAHWKAEYYVAISRPPYFTALWLRTSQCNSCCHAGFDGDAIRFKSYEGEDRPWLKVLPERVEEGSPFRFEELPDFPEWHQFLDVARPRCSGAPRKGLLYLDESWRTWEGIDKRGRCISVSETHVLADGEPFLDCRRPTFEAVVTPDWAKRW